MKKLIVLLLAITSLFGFMGCSDGSDGSDGFYSGSGSDVSYLDHPAFADYKSKKVTAIYEWVNNEISHYTMKKAFIFFEDNTYVLSDIEGLSKLEVDPEGKGTYTGDATKDGEIKIKETHMWSQDFSSTDTTKKWISHDWPESYEGNSFNIVDGKFRPGANVFTKK